MKFATNLAETVSEGVGLVRGRDGHALLALLAPALRGYLLQKGKSAPVTGMQASHVARFNWSYDREGGELAKLYAAAKRAQWDAATALPWATNVDPESAEHEIILDNVLPLHELKQWRSLPEREKLGQKAALVAWMLSQFLHGEQGALQAACQITEAVDSMDAKLYGSTQVVDEGRHVEVFHRYLTEKLGKLYEINDNLYVIIDALMTDSRWDIKFLGMQILVEGLALGAFGTLRDSSREPLLRDLLRYVIIDEGRHVHFGVVALREHYGRHLSPRDLREREDWAFEVSVMMRNRFLAHEFYDEYYGHIMSRREWNRFILQSRFMEIFRNKMFRRLIPNLKKIHLLSDRVRPYYAELGLLEWESERAATELTADDLVG